MGLDFNKTDKFGQINCLFWTINGQTKDRQKTDTDKTDKT